MSPIPYTDTRRLERIVEVKALIRRHSYWSAGFGLLPLPFVDFAAITATQAKMVVSMSKLYGARATEHVARTAVGALLGGAAPVAVGGAAISTFKMVPGLGQIVGVLVVPALAAASTVAVGRVFLEHFEAGGTLLDFDPEEMRAFYHREFEAARSHRTAAPHTPAHVPGEYVEASTAGL